MRSQKVQLLRNDTKLMPLGITCEDWMDVRQRFKERGRSTNEQVVVLLNGRIYAVEREDGDGFAMIQQDRQSLEDNFWYPDWEEKKQARMRELGRD